MWRFFQSGIIYGDTNQTPLGKVLARAFGGIESKTFAKIILPPIDKILPFIDVSNPSFFMISGFFLVLGSRFWIRSRIKAHLETTRE